MKIKYTYKNVFRDLLENKKNSLWFYATMLREPDFENKFISTLFSHPFRLGFPDVNLMFIISNKNRWEAVADEVENEIQRIYLRSPKIFNHYFEHIEYGVKALIQFALKINDDELEVLLYGVYNSLKLIIEDVNHHYSRRHIWEHIKQYLTKLEGYIKYIIIDGEQ